MTHAAEEDASKNMQKKPETFNVSGFLHESLKGSSI